MSTGRQDDEDASAPLSDWTATKNLAPAETPRPDLGFTPGTMLAGRYRVVALLGRGGMGEVYRADDTKLGQPVAIKFVRGALSPELRDRLYAEVRIGRQISHPNVCRLYDVVEVEGQTFLAMEYVDGEDLASLLARIGRLPPDKAIEIARDLCAGLAAVHEKGVAHRDLKPANVMIDGRGHARLTDFGLAVALEAPGTHTAAGTPSYMAPEQLAGGEVTLRSDLYALGLILYEMLSGRRLFDAASLEQLHAQHLDTKAPKLASVARLVDSHVERAIVQCLDEDPANRPASARAVIAALPGNDPLEAALAAGETPTPEMIAAAGKVGDLTPLAAWAMLLLLIAGFVAQTALSDRSMLLRKVTLPRPPELLAERARDVLMRLGQTSARDSAFFFEWDEAYLSHVARTDSSSGRWDKLRAAQPGPIEFLYRVSPRELVAANRDAVVTRADPPASLSGMAEVRLDPRGRLTSFLAVPPQIEPASLSWPAPDWAPLFREAGLEAADFKSVAPEWAAPVDSDRKAAWVGTYAGQPDVAIRIEAAAYHGRPVWFEILPPWAHAGRMQDPLAPFTPTTPVAEASVWLLALAMPLGGVLLARRNLRLGRGDRKAAFRVALFAFATFSLARLFRADHAGSLGEELWVLIKVFAYPSFWAIQLWLLYLALEPYARRRWPRSLISWKRLLSGSFRDPSVGRDLLVGAAAGVLISLMYRVSNQAPGWFGMPPPVPETWVDGATLASASQVFFRLFVNQFSAVLYGLAFLFVLVLLRVVLRNQYLAMALWLPLVAGPSPGGDPVVSWTISAVRGLLLLFLLTRCGLLAMVVAFYFGFSLIEAPVSFDFSTWYVTRSLPVLALLVFLAGYGFHISLAGKPVFGRPLLDD